VQRVSLIGAASGWGAGFRETEDGPLALRTLGLSEALTRRGRSAEWGAMIEPDLHWRDRPDLSRREIDRLVASHCARLAEAVAAGLADRTLPVVIGGDHSIAIGTWGGVGRRLRAPLGLIWFDAHLDAHTAETSPSLNPHGMSAAVLLGHGAPELLAVGGGVVRPENLCYIGARSYEDGELALLRRLGVRIVFMDEVDRRSFREIVAEAIGIATSGTAGFGVTIDLDGFDPADAPGIGLKTPNGLRRAQMLRAMADLAACAELVGIEIVEYIPQLDEDGRTADLVRDLLAALLIPAGQRLERAAMQPA
jgi:arginase